MPENVPRPSHPPPCTLTVHPVRHLGLHLSIASHLALSSLIALPCFYVLPGDAGAGTGRAFTAATKAIRYCWSTAGCTTTGVWTPSRQNLGNYLHLHCWKLSVNLASKQLAHHQGTSHHHDVRRSLVSHWVWVVTLLQNRLLFKSKQNIIIWDIFTHRANFDQCFGLEIAKEKRQLFRSKWNPCFKISIQREALGLRWPCFLILLIFLNVYWQKGKWSQEWPLSNWKLWL